MWMTVQFNNGGKTDALLLAVNADRIRVVVAGRRATEEWMMLDGKWFDEKGRLVEIEAMAAFSGVDYSHLADLYPRSAAAGGFGSSMA